MCDTVRKPLSAHFCRALRMIEQELERGSQRVGVWLDDEAVDAVFHEVQGFAGIATRHDRLCAT